MELSFNTDDNSASDRLGSVSAVWQTPLFVRKPYPGPSFRSVLFPPPSL